MVLGVGHVEFLAVEGHPLRMVEGGCRERAVLRPDCAGAGHVEQLAGQRGDHDAVVIAVGDEQAVRLLIGQHLARKLKRRRCQLVALEPQFERRAVERSGRRVIRDKLADRHVEFFAVSLSRIAANDLPLRIDQYKRGPRIDAQLPPHGHLRVVKDRMFDVVAQDRTANVLRIALVEELGRVDADHDQVAGILVLEVLQIGEDVHTVDAAIAPEVEQYDLAMQVAELDRAGDIEPAGAAVEKVIRKLEPLRERIRHAGRVRFFRRDVARRGRFVAGASGRKQSRDGKQSADKCPLQGDSHHTGPPHRLSGGNPRVSGRLPLLS